MTTPNIHYYGDYDYRPLQESLAIRRRLIPINKVLTTINTVEDLININDLPEPAYNLIKNPLLRGIAGNRPSGWTGYNLGGAGNGNAAVDIIATDTIVDSVTYSPGYGDRSIRITKTLNSGNFHGIYQDVESPAPGRYAVTVRVTGDASTTGTNNVGIGVFVRNSTNIPTNPGSVDDEYSSFIYTPNTPLFDQNTWEELTVVHDVPRENLTVRVWVGISGLGPTVNGLSSTTSLTSQLENSVFIDAVQFEPDFATLAGDVSMDAYHEHDPSFSAFVNPHDDRYSRYLIEESTHTEFNTASIREQQMSEILKVRLVASGGAVLVDFDRDVRQTGESILLQDGDVFEDEISIRDKITFINPSGSSDLPTLRGYVLGQ